MSKAFRNTLLAISLTYIVLGLIQILWPVGSRMVICYIMGAALTLFGICLLYTSTSPLAGLLSRLTSSA